ncbi:hypothetical protein [Mangrovicoccus ximenensis]|uniref:hypothetical protein n=1 Tax=Mangrovicoccus ximenensis TaxID=1911570 RepID=UPI000D351FED|nr:hypothetical protein [Mangrovicoccus ximenensis]
MTSPLDRLARRIRDLEQELEDELGEKRRIFRYRLERRRVVFEADVLARHRAAREKLSGFLARTRLLVLLTAPFIYALVLPLALLDLSVMLYQAVCFPVYGIEKVPRRDYIILDRRHLQYLNGLQKLNCVYCGYANGVIGWVREVASRTEAYWCPIKHARRVAEPHLRYPGFADFGDETDFQEGLAARRAALRGEDGTGG